MTARMDGQRGTRKCACEIAVNGFRHFFVCFFFFVFADTYYNSDGTARMENINSNNGKKTNKKTKTFFHLIERRTRRRRRRRRRLYTVIATFISSVVPIFGVKPSTYEKNRGVLLIFSESDAAKSEYLKIITHHIRENLPADVCLEIRNRSTFSPPKFRLVSYSLPALGFKKRNK